MLGSSDSKRRALSVVQEQLRAAAAAAKCHGCGCLHNTVESLAGTETGRKELGPVLEEARRVFQPKEYDCLGCPVCYPAIAANAFSEAFPREGEGMDLCPTDAVAERRGWPPLPGDYHVVRFQAPVAVCTLNSPDLAGRVAQQASEGVSIVGALRTENLGIERLIRNMLANPHIRFLILCGRDTKQVVGHLPGQSLVSLFVGGLDDRGRIVGALGKRPVLKNVRVDQVEAFRRQVELVAIIGEEGESAILDRARDCAKRDPGSYEGAPADTPIDVVQAVEHRRLVPDPAGFFVVYPDAPRRRLVVEHYTNAGVLTCVIEGSMAVSVYGAAIERELVSRLDHAAYLGRELARAEQAMRAGEPYVQDRAPGDLPDETDRARPPCGGNASCGPGDAP